MPKKTTKSVQKKPTMKTTKIHEQHCGCGAECHCHHHDTKHLIKHIIVWAIIFALGMACGKMMNCHHGKKMMRPRFHPVFTNGCLDIKSIECPKFREDILKADANGDNCISLEEYRTVKKPNKNYIHKGKFKKSR